MDKDDLVRGCYDWQVRSLKVEGWAKKVKYELDKVGLGNIWQDQQGRSVGRTCGILKDRCSIIESFAKIREEVIGVVLGNEMRVG